MNTDVSQAVFTGVPGFFRATCHAASRGGSSGYEVAGFTLARSLYSLCPTSIEDDDWRPHVETMQALLAEGGDVLAWFDRYFPRCMALVPSRRRDAFLSGVRRAEAEEEISN